MNSVSPSQPQSSLRSVSVVSGFSLVQLVVQFGIQLALAKYFGAAGEMDAYVTALAPPLAIATILSGSLGYVLIPLFTQRLTKYGEPEAVAVSSQVGIYLLGLSGLVTILVVLSAPLLVTVLCPGFPVPKRETTAGLLQILALLIPANSLVAFLNALFHCFRRFTTPALAGVVGPLMTLGYVAAFHNGQGIFAVAWGVVIGAAVTTVILLPLFLSHLRLPLSRQLTLHEGTRRCFGLLVPLVLGSMYWRLDPLLDRLLASYLPTGSVSHLGYAWRLTLALITIGTSGLSIVAFPAISAHAAAGRNADLYSEVAHALRFLLFLLVPVIVGLGWFAEPVVRLLFEHGRFTSADTRAVAFLLVLYLGVVLGASLGDLLSRALYSLQDTRTPVVVSTISFTLAAAAKILLVGWYGASVLAAATTLYYGFNAACLTALLVFRLGSDVLRGTGICLVRSLASSVIACLAANFVERLGTSLALLPAIAAGAAVYLLVAWGLGDEFARKLEQFGTRRRQSEAS
jgi:putative peptidoglycan lipid II flippase